MWLTTCSSFSPLLRFCVLSTQAYWYTCLLYHMLVDTPEGTPPDERQLILTTGLLAAAWGTLKLYSKDVMFEDNEGRRWGYGQVINVMIFLTPLIALSDQFV